MLGTVRSSPRDETISSRPSRHDAPKRTLHEPGGARERGRVLELVTRHGWNTTSFQTLESGYSYFFHGDDACVAYVDTGRAWVAAGVPLCASTELCRVTTAFVNAAAAVDRRACLFATEDRFRHATWRSLEHVCIGEQPSFDPKRWAETLRTHRSLREQLRRAATKGVTLRELGPEELLEPQTRRAITRLAERWLESRRAAPMGFLVRVEPFTSPEHRMTFVAERGGALVAFAALVPIPARSGWLIEDLVRGAEAPNGTVELLVDAAMRWAGARDAAYVTLGLAPLAGPVAPALRWARHASFLYDFHGLHAFKAKFRPERWSPRYVSFPRGQGAPLSLFDAVSAFAPDGILPFAWRTAVSTVSRWTASRWTASRRSPWVPHGRRCSVALAGVPLRGNLR